MSRRRSELLVSIALFALRAGRIMRSPLAGRFKRKILKTHISLNAPVMKRPGAEAVIRPIVGFRVAAYSLETLRFLFNEIFVELQYLFRAGSSRPFIVDCGSNIGMSIIFFKALYPEATIVGFEPEAGAFRLLQRNLAENGVEGVTLHNLALGDHDGDTDFFADPENPASLHASSHAKRNRYPGSRVRQVRLSRFIERNVDLLKLDTEGAEESILRDLEDSGTLRFVEQMMVEYHHHVDESRNALAEFLAVLERNGFGYQIGAMCDPGMKQRGGPSFQDIQIYAYRQAR